MKMTRLLLILLLLTALCAGCGNKGALVHPDKAGDAPAEPTPEKEMSADVNP
jgi:predicted small lipoprotein YifL